MAALDTLFASIVNPLNHGSTMDAATINAALTAIGADDSILLIPNTNRNRVENSWVIDANVTVPSNVVLLVPYGSVISVSSGFTWTQNGQVIADRYQIWSGLGTTTFGSTIDVRAEWTGGSAYKMVEALASNGLVDVSKLAIQDSATSSTELQLKATQTGINNIENAKIEITDSINAEALAIETKSAGVFRLICSTTADFEVNSDTDFTDGLASVMRIDITNNQIILSGIPTSSAGLPSGALWSNSNVINIVP